MIAKDGATQVISRKSQIIRSPGRRRRSLICGPWSGTVARPVSAAWIFCGWGLMPHWANDINVGFARINAKADQASLPRFLPAAAVPRAAFTNVKRTATGKQPYAIALAD